MATADYYGGAAQDELNRIVDFYKNPDYAETDTAAAERSYANPGFAAPRRLLMRRSQRMQDLAAATPILEAQAGRATQYALQTQGEKAALERAVLAGQQAQEQERLRQIGELQHDTRAAAAQRAAAILEGQQALQRLQLSEMGQTYRQGISEQGQNYRSANDIQSRVAMNTANNQTSRWNTAAGIQGHIATTQIANPPWNADANQQILQQIREATRGTGSGGPAPTAQPAWKPTQWQDQSQNYDSSGSLVQPQGSNPSYYFGAGTDVTDDSGVNRKVTPDDFYYLTGGEGG